eukprot:COSAG01_NODE_277_length_19582_cov_28.126726_16_plen_137_part_00
MAGSSKMCSQQPNPTDDRSAVQNSDVERSLTVQYVVLVLVQLYRYGCTSRNQFPPPNPAAHRQTWVWPFTRKSVGCAPASEQLPADAAIDVAQPAAAAAQSANLRICELRGCGCVGVWGCGGVSFRTVMKFRETGI